MVKILHVLGGLNRGGAETLIMNVYRKIDRTKYSFDFLVYNNISYDYEEEVMNLGGRIFKIKYDSGHIYMFGRKFKELLKGKNFDVIHVHTLLNSGLILRIAYNNNIRVRICHSHNTRNSEKKTVLDFTYELLMKRWIRIYTTDFLACSIQAGIYLFGKQLCESKCLIIKNGIDLENFTSFVRENNLSNTKLVLGSIARFSPVKNHQFMIDIMKELHRLNIDTILILVGEGELKSTILKYAIDHVISDKVTFTGTINNVGSMLREIDILIMPSLFEGLCC
ncbi:glycosyl transferase family 1 [Clostridia bacterium]|nr:glycosyl transferase family 1 [Clostridia bacterium]